jgi:hypothetical protein
VAIEKAFAIRATPPVIFEALEEDLFGAAEHLGDTFDIISREQDRLLELRVTIGDIPCWLTYRLEPRADHTEVVATLIPFGWRYTFFKIITFGMRDQNFAVTLVEGLSNLKEAAESAAPATRDGG